MVNALVANFALLLVLTMLAWQSQQLSC